MTYCVLPRDFGPLSPMADTVMADSCQFLDGDTVAAADFIKRNFLVKSESNGR